MCMYDVRTQTQTHIYKYVYIVTEAFIANVIWDVVLIHQMILLTRALPILAWHLLSHHETLHETLFTISKTTTWFYTYYGRFMSKTFYGSCDRRTSSVTGKKLCCIRGYLFWFLVCLQFRVPAAMTVWLLLLLLRLHRSNRNDLSPWNIMHWVNIEILIFNYGRHCRRTVFSMKMCFQKWIWANGANCKYITGSTNQIYSSSHECRKATNQTKGLQIVRMQ